MDWATGLSMPSVSGRKTYDKLFKARLSASNVEALDVLFTNVQKGSCRR
jgi:hypothetical protein